MVSLNLWEMITNDTPLEMENLVGD